MHINDGTESMSAATSLPINQIFCKNANWHSPRTRYLISALENTTNIFKRKAEVYTKVLRWYTYKIEGWSKIHSTSNYSNHGIFFVETNFIFSFINLFIFSYSIAQDVNPCRVNFIICVCLLYHNKKSEFRSFFLSLLGFFLTPPPSI